MYNDSPPNSIRQGDLFEMRVGAHVEIVGVNRAYEEAFPLLKKLGAQGVELVIREGGLIDISSPDYKFLQIRRLARDEGLEILGATNGYSWTLPMTSENESIRQAGDAAMKRALEITALLGADSLLIVPGYASTTFISSYETVPVTQAIKRAKEGVRSSAMYAKALGVSANVEVVWNGMLRNPREMYEFFSEIAEDGIGMYLDTGNVCPEGRPPEWIKTMHPFIRRVHVKDYSFLLSGMKAFCPLGNGDLDLKGAICLLQRYGYDGWITAEHHNMRDEASAAHSLRYLHSILKLLDADILKGRCRKQ